MQKTPTSLFDLFFTYFFSVNFLFTVQFSSDYFTQNHGMVREDSERKY